MHTHALAITGAALLVCASAAGGEETPMLHLSGFVDQHVELAGKKSRVPWQHLMGFVPGKTAEYFDPEDGGNQIVVHVAGGLESEGPCVLWGKVLEVRGASKRPKRKGDKGTKVDDSYVEYALDVERVVWVPAPEELPGLVERLLAPSLAREAKEALEARLVAAGLAAVPLLLERLQDARVVWRERRVQNLGELMNRPVVAAGPEPAPREVEVEITLGQRAEAMLHRIVAPRNYRSPHFQMFKPRSAGYDGGMLRVKDWRAFFARRQGRTLAEIRAALQPAVDRWYQTKGEEQQVE